ncbi:MAG: PD-(D/E)XK nuclease family transposase [Alphaproteobacteria bacterium]|nr:PD-(D/E)XK nuclease family transposase [Alphaproteobacteria bacterium]
MTHRIDPKVDFVFKKLLGSPANLDLLVDFLDSVLGLPEPIREVELLNPFNEREFRTDKLSVVDVKAVDARGRRFQAEIQLQAHPALAPRVIFTWGRVFGEQLTAGDRYHELRPTYSIWILDDVLLPDSSASRHHFRLHDPALGVTLSEHLNIHLIELPKWRCDPDALTRAERWIYFFKDAGAWEELPPALGDPTMRKAMGVLKNISQRERDMAVYESRMDQLRVRRTWEYELELAEARLAEARAQAAQAEAQAAEDRAELQRLRERLRALGEAP